jgi:hypothetical protein
VTLRDDDEVDDEVDPYDADLSLRIVEAIGSGGPVCFEHFASEFRNGDQAVICCTIRDGRGGTGPTPGVALMRAVTQDPPAAIVRPFVEPAEPTPRKPPPKDETLLIETLVAMARRASGEMQSRQLRQAFEDDLRALLKEHGR